MPWKIEHRNEKLRARVQARRVALLDGKCCAKCGFNDPRALEFHHRDGTDKIATIGRMMLWGWEKLLAEVAKCDLLCANCHSIEHASKDWK